ncbi:2-furoyl-CoA dehydrogenase FAD binding subunit [Tistlia consotensis]|uniref:2-furoyl-CoA dehydrogenase FAD binding subunit n=1 Tax=Tistlia consotensis USBA 355 TaxID=560819 RepID=A0A1Y6CPN4_9PROT|nr:FAD binding domain-containing protein [Tistlia consotensis]SMF80107.1 2-furoyl-CoA dehydrogenase FAD binding subunit [Tistlia consotensis USBA 355]SNR62187.1 2-furoyl-CoA dehydrogenase FAD binding subunit [Tistlia consotensis]
MKPARFDYQRAESAAEACEALAELGGDARVLAGGQSLVPMLNMRLAQPRLLVDISRIEALQKIERSGGRLLVGAGARQAALLSHDGLAEAAPLLAAALPWVGHAQTRARGTVCGSLAHADPSAELPTCLLALQGAVRLRSSRRHRELPAEAFLAGLMSTAREDDELVEAAAFPLRRAGEGQAFREFGRRHGDFAIVGAAAVVSAQRIRLAVGGVADRPMARDWPALEGSALDDALNAFAWELGARDDLHASARLRRDLVRALGREAIEEARRCRA